MGGSVGWGVVGESGSRVGVAVTGYREGASDTGRSVGLGVLALQLCTKAQHECSGSSHSMLFPLGQAW